MEYVTLHNTTLQVSRLCMGGCPMGRYGWGQVSEEELIRAVHAALDQEICFFDTADTYGLGTSERILGKALGLHRPQAVIATKFGVRVENGRTFYDNTPEWTVFACEQSLHRLGTDYIDLYQLHYRNPGTSFSTLTDTLKLLQAQGKIRYYGICNVSSGMLTEYDLSASGYATVQNQYSLCCRNDESLLRMLAQTNSATPLTWGSLGQGILTGKYDRSVSFGSDDRRSRPVYVNFHADKLEKNLMITEALKEIAASRQKPVSAVALRFILDNLPGSVALCGAKRPEQILENVQALNWHLTEEEIRILDQISR